MGPSAGPGQHPGGRRAHAAGAAPAHHCWAPSHHPGQGGDAQPGRQRKGPDRASHDRGCRAARPAEAGWHHRRADLRQHRPRAGHRGGPQGLSNDLRDGRQAVARENCAPARLRRRSGGLSDRSTARVARKLLLGGRTVEPRDPGRLSAEPVFQPGKPAVSLRDDRSRDLAADRWKGRRRGRRVGNGGHGDGCRPVPQRKEGVSDDRRRRGRSTRARPSSPTRWRGSAKTSFPARST